MLKTLMKVFSSVKTLRSGDNIVSYRPGFASIVSFVIDDEKD